MVQIILSIIYSKMRSCINCSARYCLWSGSILSLLAWVVDWEVYFFHLVFPLILGVGSGVEEIGIVFLADRALESKMILTDLNDVLKSTRWSPKYRTSNRKSGRYKTVPIPVTLLKKYSWVWIWINSMKHWVSAEHESTVDCCHKKTCNAVMC